MAPRCLLELPEGVIVEVLGDEPLVATVAGASGRDVDDPWVRAVALVLEREPSWLNGSTPSDSSRVLQVRPGQGEMFHASSTQNRQSIEAHGLDWRRMGTALGIAGSRRPEAPAVFLNESWDEAAWFARMGREGGRAALHHDVDIWGAIVDEIWIATGPDGWWMTFAPVSADRVRLVSADPETG